MTSESIKRICAELKCSESDIIKVEPIKVGLTNSSWSFYVGDSHYVCREAGRGTNRFINRESEAFTEEIASLLKLDTALIAIDGVTGFKLSHFVENTTYIDPFDEADCELAMKTVRRLHDANVTTPWDFDYCEQAEMILSFEDFDAEYDREIHERMLCLGDKLKDKGFRTCLCHNDAWSYNMLKGADGEITLIDWEYSGNSYPASDVAYFTASIDCEDEYYLHLAELYEQHTLSADEKWYYHAVMAIVMWYWYIWALYKEILGTYVEDKELWYKKAIEALERAEEEEKI